MAKHYLYPNNALHVFHGSFCGAYLCVFYHIFLSFLLVALSTRGLHKWTWIWGSDHPQIQLHFWKTYDLKDILRSLILSDDELIQIRFVYLNFNAFPTVHVLK